MLSVQNLSFHYQPERIILKDISFDLGSHEILCLLGPNGTGKTTLIRCILSLNKMKSGRITLNGLDISKISPKRRAELMAYVPQATTVAFPYEAAEIVQMGRVVNLSLGARPSARDRKLAEEAMEKMGILHMSSYPFNEMSGGEKQMVLIARAIAQQAKILVMDEPTANLDYYNQVKMLKVIKALAEQGYAILMTSHFPDHAFLACSKAVLMRDGVIMAQGHPDEVVTTENLTRLYSTPVCVAEARLDAMDTAMKVCIPVMNN
ncbi:ABC transporter ATP-binding protein [Desulfitobacterium chlororespirans]|uniref:Iron complex transport system ATP-binding protein n=1 Tax=Desulfitobacterium chlororespirans DSM 11544 TaxID=1121395 RepID=A0A1M7UYQ3_9FIRM|nr:ABC transporter ATP-binding protein [Desulfitobacterium chlororespirans]SHN88171.1 iron complex transport system ATP-binding protein [Desulfitobacterium chlororespirans DSM 11544]